jgi:uncharacterized membrane protein
LPCAPLLPFLLLLLALGVCAQSRSIGADLALFYEAYATWLELRGAYAKAAAVYTEGLQR